MSCEEFSESESEERSSSSTNFFLYRGVVGVTTGVLGVFLRVGVLGAFLDGVATFLPEEEERDGDRGALTSIERRLAAFDLTGELILGILSVVSGVSRDFVLTGEE